MLINVILIKKMYLKNFLWDITQRCNRFAAASKSTQVAVLPWRYDAKMGTANSLHASA